MLPSLDQLGTIREQCVHGALRGAHDSYMTRGVGIRILKDREYKAALVGQPLRLPHSTCGPPASLASCVTCEPVILCVGQQNLPMLRWTKEVDTQLLRGSGREGAAVCMRAGSRVVGATIRLASFPVDMFVDKPKRLDVHRIESVGEPLSRRGDRSAARGVLMALGVNKRRRKRQRQRQKEP
jgi:hypothetical protein